MSTAGTRGLQATLGTARMRVLYTSKLGLSTYTHKGPRVVMVVRLDQHRMVVVCMGRVVVAWLAQLLARPIILHIVVAGRVRRRHQTFAASSLQHARDAACHALVSCTLWHSMDQPMSCVQLLAFHPTSFVTFALVCALSWSLLNSLLEWTAKSKVPGQRKDLLAYCHAIHWILLIHF